MYLRARNFGISYCPRSLRSFANSPLRKHPGRAGGRTLAAGAADPVRALNHQLNLATSAPRGATRFQVASGEGRDCALVVHPAQFILLDEPFSGIDPIAVLELQKTSST